jgi:hypothetical protein
VPKNLVLARVGRSSLHPCWLNGAGPRDFDLVLVPYEPIAPQTGVDCTVLDVVPGPKWSGLRQVLEAWDGWREYDQVWMPDDDVYADRGTVSRIFAVAGGAGLDLFAPALHETSAYAHFSTMRNRRFFARLVGFVEIMVPGFSREALERLRPTLELSGTGWGWGLDSVWPKLLDYRGVAIIDGAPVIHTRPVGQLRDAELARRVHAESDELLARFDCRQEHVTFGALDAALDPVELTADRLLLDLVRGWDYLVERDPRVLGWVAEFQRAHHPPAAYPVEGTP